MRFPQVACSEQRCATTRGDGAALVVKFATSIVLRSDGRPVRRWAHADIPLEGALEGAYIAKPRGEGDPGNRVVMGAHQLHATLHAKDSDPFGERQAVIVRERFVMEALSESRNPHWSTHEAASSPLSTSTG